MSHAECSLQSDTGFDASESAKAYFLRGQRGIRERSLCLCPLSWRQLLTYLARLYETVY